MFGYVCFMRQRQLHRQSCSLWCNARNCHVFKVVVWYIDVEELGCIIVCRLQVWQLHHSCQTICTFSTLIATITTPSNPILHQPTAAHPALRYAHDAPCCLCKSKACHKETEHGTFLYLCHLPADEGAIPAFTCFSAKCTWGTMLYQNISIHIAMSLPG